MAISMNFVLVLKVTSDGIGAPLSDCCYFLCIELKAEKSNQFNVEHGSTELPPKEHNDFNELLYRSSER